MLLSFMLRHRWSHLAVRRYWTLGYQAEPIIALFHTLPRRLRSAIAQALDAVQRCPNSADIEPSDAEDPAARAACGWEDDDLHGFVSAEFDPVSQARVRVAANARAAALLGMHLEELLARYARRDVPLALPPIDAMRAFLHSLHRGVFADGATCYYRIVPPPCPNGRPSPAAALVCAESVRVFAASGRIQEVGRHRRISQRCSTVQHSITAVHDCSLASHTASHPSQVSPPPRKLFCPVSISLNARPPLFQKKINYVKSIS
jgi:hypothetical protein